MKLNENYTCRNIQQLKLFSIPAILSLVFDVVNEREKNEGGIRVGMLRIHFDVIFLQSYVMMAFEF